jgi:alkylation response protein AidB-like acyl-CoA dehydrogenase
MTTQATRTRTDLQAFREEAAAWLAENVPARWREYRGALSEEEATEIRHDWERRLYKGGYAGLSLPVEYGGRGLGLAEEVAFHELAASAHAPDGLGRIGKVLTAPTLIAHGTEEQRRAYLPSILSGDTIWCQGFSEPEAGSDLANIKCSARRVEGGYRVTGRKIWTSFARQADRCLLLVRTDENAPRHKNLTMLLLDMTQPGITITPIKQISGASHFAEVQFDDVFVAESDRVGDEGEGWHIAMTVLANERGAVEAATRYVEIRADMDLLLECCGRDRGQDALLSELDTRVDLIRWQVGKAVARRDDEKAHIRSSSVLKVCWSELWQQITTLGAKSLCPTHRAHWRFQYLEIRSTSIYSGTSEIQRNIISERVLGLPK